MARDIDRAIGDAPENMGKYLATREDLSRKSTASRELVADYWTEGLFSPGIGKCCATRDDRLQPEDCFGIASEWPTARDLSD
jgi:hypothetical protein